MDISGIEASAAYDPTLSTAIATYTGMMDTAAKWKAGSITEKNLVAGELAFVTATTNNQSVRVDFSSWVMDSTGLGLVLGNVDSVVKPTHTEYLYYVYDNGDGTVGVTIDAPGNSGQGMTLVDTDLYVAYSGYRQGLSPKPVSSRCAGSLNLFVDFGEPVPSGQCDTGLAVPCGSFSPTRCPMITSRYWSAVSGTTAPMNAYMRLPPSATSPLVRNGKNVISETYIHLWEGDYSLASASIGGTAGTDRAKLGIANATGTPCVIAQASSPDFAFDKDLNYPWCSTSVPSTSSPGSLMYQWGAAIPITSYAVTSSGSFSYDVAPKTWTFQGCTGSCTVGSDTGWVTLDSRTGETFSGTQTKTYSFSNTTAYSQYRLRTTANGGSTSQYAVGELQFFDSGGAVVFPAGNDRTENGTTTWAARPCYAPQDQTQHPARAFDNLMTSAAGTQWCAKGVPTAALPISISYGWSGTSYAISSYSIASAGDTPTRDPKDWTFDGCNGTCLVSADTGWVTLDTRTNQSFASRYQANTYSFANATQYSRYRLRFTASNGDTTSFQLAEIQMFDGACAPETDGSFCSRVAKNCGSVTAADNCGTSRTAASCGICTSPQTCAGGGVSNVCGSAGPSYISSGGTVTASNAGTSPTDMTKAFDQNVNSTWIVLGVKTPSITYQFAGTTTRVVSSYVIGSAVDLPKRDPKSWVLEGSNNGTTWTAVDTQSNQAFANRLQLKTYTVASTTPYNRYRFRVTANNTAQDFQMSEIQLIGY